MSWLKPACEVQRSALPVSVARQLDAGARVRVSGVADVESMSFHVLPSLLACVSWRVSTALVRVAAVAGTSSAVNRLGENLPLPDGHAPAPAQMVAPGA